LKPRPATFVGIDIGGTFTDFVVYHPAEQRLETFKLLSPPRNPAEAVLAGLKRIRAGLPPGAPLQVVHGSTVATNALLERKGASTALIATYGFKDMLQIGRQNRPELYNLAFEAPAQLVPVELRCEVDERVSAEGEVLQALDAAQVEALIPQLRAAGAESVAVCLLFSFLHPAHEQQIAATLRQAGFFVSASHEVLPEFREYERASTTAVNAYVSPALDGYLARLVRAEGDTPLRVMQSNGGSIRLEEARRNGVRCILSGPAGGVVGAKYLAHKAKPPDEKVQVITFDMGGTSTDVALIDGEPRLATDAVVGGCPIRIPMLDIHTIGAGGGSIAFSDAGGALRVGPRSAGADPGPACYGRGDLPTVTDANLVLGRLPGERFLGGGMPLDAKRASGALDRLGRSVGLDAKQVALGVIEIVNAHMERALRVISVERGYDPRSFTLLSFGGAGGLHATDLARRLGMPRVLVPPVASTLSAFGMLAADVIRDYSLTVMLPGETLPTDITARLGPLVERGRRDLLDEGIPEQDICIEASLDIGHHIITVEGYRSPTNNSDVFVILGEQAILPRELVPRLVEMARFRNLLVHEYTRLDNALVYGILSRRLGDFDEFARAVVAYLEGR